LSNVTTCHEHEPVNAVTVHELEPQLTALLEPRRRDAEFFLHFAPRTLNRGFARFQAAPGAVDLSSPETPQLSYEQHLVAAPDEN
jgi:hypothetical protein